MTSGPVALRETASASPEPDVALTHLLDHIAAELAAEYVRLMEAAADGNRRDAADPMVVGVSSKEPMQ